MELVRRLLVMKPSPPHRPEQTGKRSRGWLTIAFTIVTIVLLLAFVAAFSIPLTIVIGLLVGFVLMHYVLWGWWVKAVLDDDEAVDQDPGTNS